ncbi:hypothetical protein PT974_07483 [Cladobotryum mycophilum]|uniref:Major capsid protein n=1 Tax=Cladobotryum mycophilum TaxID=491253 RepID=A0ABR0SPK9_9HYPO
MPIERGTLAGFDQLLSISQESIQRQLKLLYLTEVDPPIEGGPTHLINHEMHFHFSGINTKTGNKFFAKDGIDAYVCCPEVELGGQSFPDPTHPDRYRIAIIRFKFRRAEEWEVTEEEVKQGKRWDSVYIHKNVYQDDDTGDDVVEYQEIAINERDIQDVFKDIIEPATSKTNMTAITANVKKGLEEVNQKNFQISTIFCAMQSARLIQSFKLVDQNGNVPQNIKTTKGELVDVQSMIEAFITTMGRRFTGQNNPATQGFAAAANIPTPVYFVPKSFRINLSPSNQYSAGTLNYGMLTHRAMQPPILTEKGLERQIDYGIDGAGRFRDNIFSRLKTKAVPGVAEGVLFFAQDIFVNHWIGSSVAPLFYLSPSYVSRKAAAAVESSYNQLNVKNRMNIMFGDNLQRHSCDGKVYKMTNSSRSDRRIIAENALDDPTESIKMEYGTTTKISYDNLYPLKDEDDDVKRRLKLTIGSYTHIKLRFFRRKATSHVGKAFEQGYEALKGALGGSKDYVDYNGDDNWEEAYDEDVWLNYKYTFEIGTSARNRGSFEISSTHGEHLDGNQQLKSTHGYPPWNEAPGMYKVTKTHNWAETFEWAFDKEKGCLNNIAGTIATDGATVMAGALDDLVKSLGTTVILPAGSVFMFKGFSTDDAGNVFTVINYDTSTDDEVQLQRSKDVLHTRWRTPAEPVAGGRLINVFG